MKSATENVRVFSKAIEYLEKSNTQINTKHLKANRLQKTI